MPRRLPLRDLAAGLLSSICTAIKYWLHYTLVAIAWLGVVPVTACRIYRALFAGTVDAILTLPFELLSMENLASDIFQGCFVVTCTLFAFAGLVWLREQILHGGGPDWLQRDNIVPPVAILNNNIEEEELEEEPPPAQEEPIEEPLPPPVNEVFEEEPIPQQPLAEDELIPPALQDENEANGAEDNNWIPMEWDRAAEEITWERLLGLDGSLMFLEHVFWVISLNTVFILIFAYSPYHMGLMTLSLINLRESASSSHFEGLLTTLIGYCTVGIFFVFFS